jgi:pimeloyl-ACP methyl ester carboxylesterase
MESTISCSSAGRRMVELRKEDSEILKSTCLVGTVQALSKGDGPIIVAACAKCRGAMAVADYTVLHDSGEFELMVAQGDYYVFAYRDRNRNLIYETGEPAEPYGHIVSAPAGGVVRMIDLTIPKTGGSIEVPDGFKISPLAPQRLISREAGTILSLDDDLFSAENGMMGFWEPTKFFKEISGTIYFLEKYDPKKIPILFIHGACGTPGGWKNVVDHIDRKRFQPWFFYYPSGARISAMSHLLSWKMDNLQKKYGFDELYITAHSMGGLVARSFIIDYGKYFPYVKLFVALSTPWGGDKMAENGVEKSPAVIPCWLDMQPEGRFIKSLYREKMPASVKFYMFYGYQGHRNPFRRDNEDTNAFSSLLDFFRSNNDGTITLSSLLDIRAQSEPKMVWGFDEGHTSILSSRDVIDQYNSIINSADEEAGASTHPAGGYIRLRLSSKYPLHGARPFHSLVLLSEDRRHAETIRLNDGDIDKILGPFPPGKYFASIIALADKPDKESVPISIRSKQTKDLEIMLSADGIIEGQITTALKSGDRSVGMPVDWYLPEGKKIVIHKIELRGEGIHRTIHPLQGKEAAFYEHIISRDDVCYHGYFRIFGLPAGKYQIIVDAEDYKPLVETQTVIPGQYHELNNFELTPACTKN